MTRWSDLERQLKPGPAIRAALPAAHLRTLNWLILPWLLIAILKQIIGIPLALVLASLSLLFGQLLDNQWKRLWLNRSERQRAALALIGIQKVLRLPLSILQNIGHTRATALAFTLQNIGQQLPLALGRSLPALTLFIASNDVVAVASSIGIICTLGTGVWFGNRGFIAVVSNQTKSKCISRILRSSAARN